MNWPIFAVVRATSETLRPGSPVSSTMRSFSSGDQRRRRSTPSIISETGSIGTLEVGLVPIVRDQQRLRGALHLHRQQFELPGRLR